MPVYSILEVRTKQIQGLRGIAALFVVSSHLVLCYARALVNACCAPDSDSPYLFQRPILRLPANGHTWVAIFFLLLGFVNALKPVRLARSGQPDLASSNLARGAFGRICRLILPASLVTTISWGICQFKLYETARFSDAFWLIPPVPHPVPMLLQHWQTSRMPYEILGCLDETVAMISLNGRSFICCKQA